MRDYFIFRLHGALASWGDIAVGDIRPSYRCPSKSAVIGLIAAALGIERHEQIKQTELFKLSFSLRIDALGHPIEDYHTVQTPSDMAIKYDRSKDCWTRLDEIEAINWRIIQTQSNAGAIQSRRTYYCDALYTIALCETVTQAIDWEILGLKQFSDLINALQNPKLSLYLGRKSCPLSLPLEPQIHSAVNFKEALQKATFKFEDELKPLTKKVKQHQYYSEEKLDNSQMKLTRRDQPVNKTTWQFSERDEYYFVE
jgi:CRISPR system Cascade subunit CasD